MAVTKIYIGGPTQAGKSTLAKHISWTTGLLAIDLDIDRWIALARRRFNYKARTPLQRWRTIQMLQTRRSSFVAEGIYLTPQSADRHLRNNASVLTLFIGYPNVSVADKKHLIQQNGYRDSHYLKRLSPAALDLRLQGGIRISRLQQTACQNLGIPYFDFSDVTQLRQSQEKVAFWVQRRMEYDKGPSR